MPRRMCLSRSLAIAFFLLVSARGPLAQARNLMSADGPGGTYDLLKKAYTVEVPDCGHPVEHMTEAFDDELGKNVFIFHAHVKEDDDRCSATDRQRTEIRAKASDIVANNNETVYYRWKFKLPVGFQTSPNFTHIMQIKSDMGAPVMTLTPRNTTIAIDGRIGSHGSTDLAKFLGTWVVADLKILFSHTGHVQLVIKRYAGGETLFSYSGDADMWDDNASAHDSKFGIYRSLLNADKLRDEQVRFADFCASKVSASECDDGNGPPTTMDAGVAARDGASEAGSSARDAGTKADAAAMAEPDASPDPRSIDANKPPTVKVDAAQRPEEPEPEDPDPPRTSPSKSGAGGCSISPAAGPGATVIAFVMSCLLCSALRRHRRP